MCNQPLARAPCRTPRILGLRCLAEHHPPTLFSSKSYTRAGLQGIVNCSCSANLHKSILNQLSGLAKSAPGVSQPGNAPGVCTRCPTQRDPDVAPMTFIYTGCLEREIHVADSPCVRALEFARRPNKVPPTPLG